MNEKSKDLRSKIIGTIDLHKEKVDVPEWPEVTGLHVKKLTILEALALDSQGASIEETKVIGLYVAYTLCDEEGSRIFDPAEDVDLVLAKDRDVIERIFDQAMALNNPKVEAKGDDPGESSPPIPKSD